MAKRNQMTVQDIPVGKVKPAPYNPRRPLKPGEPAYERLKKAVETFGLVEPLVWNSRSGHLIGGHQRFAILKARGDKKVAVSVVDLDERDEKALNLALNRHAGDWDVEALASLVAELNVGTFDMDLTGFDATELMQLETGTPLSRGDVERVLLASLHPDERNVRTHDPRSIETIQASLIRFGQQKPIVVTRKDRIIRAGNGAYEAAQNLGWQHILVQWSDLSPQDAIAFALADNRTTDVSTFDTRELSMALQALKADGYDISVLGWKDYELEPLLQASWTPPVADTELSDFQRNAHDGESVFFTADQIQIINRAINKLHDTEGDSSIPRGRALELICAEFLS